VKQAGEKTVHTPSEIASLDPEAQALLMQLTPEGAEPGTPPTFGVDKDEGTSAAAAPAPAEPTPTPAPTPQPTPAPTAAPADPQAPAATPAPTPAPTSAPAEPQGDPRAALRHARRNERKLREDNERLAREVEELRSKVGTDPGGKGTSLEDMTDEQLAEVEENFPLQAAAVREIRALKATVQRLEQTAKPAAPSETEWEAPTFDPRVQDVIDQVPTLLAWQYSKADQDKFALATDFDASLLHDPVWKSKTPVERFQEAVRRTEQHLGVSSTAAPPARQDPAAVIAAAPSQAPAGVSDFRGGGPAQPPTLDYSRMTNEQILASLKPE
jgi:hypothetical protein